MNKIIKDQIIQLKPSATLAINEESNRLKKSGKDTLLSPENNNYKPIKLTENNDVVIWGVVTNVIHKV